MWGASLSFKDSIALKTVAVMLIVDSGNVLSNMFWEKSIRCWKRFIHYLLFKTDGDIQ